MSAATASFIDHHAEEINQKPVSKGPGKAQGKAVHNGPTITPEATPEPDIARNEADDRRRQKEEEQDNDVAVIGAMVNDAAAKNQRLSNNDQFDTGNMSSGHRDVIYDILKCRPNDHRNVLGISESYADSYEEEKAIERATWRRGTDTHPKYNKRKDAQKAFDRVIEAAVGLDCSEDWIEELKDWDGAGDSDDDESDDGQNGMDLDEQTPALTIRTEKLYQEASFHIAQLQKNPKSKAASKELDKINSRIQEMNENDGVEPVDQWKIDYQGLAGYYREAMPFIRRIKKNTADDEAREKIDEVNQRLNGFISKHRYLDWKIYPAVVLSGQPEPETPTSAKAPATPTHTENTAKAPMKPANEWKPGLTEKGERMMAMAPTETNDVLGNPTMTRCLFLVEKKGQKNPIAFEDAADVGEKAARGYLEQLPKSERIDIRSRMNSYSPKDRKGFVRIKGVAAKEGDNPERYPDCAVWVEYEDGSYKFPNRSGCRAIWKSKADRMIEDFFLDNRCPQKSLTKGQQLKSPGSAMEGRKPGERKKLQEPRQKKEQFD